MSNTTEETKESATNPIQNTRELGRTGPASTSLTRRKLAKRTRERREAMMSFQPKPPSWLAPNNPLLLTKTTSEAALRKKRDTQRTNSENKGETKNTTMPKPMITKKMHMNKERMSPYDDYGQPPPEDPHRRKIVVAAREKEIQRHREKKKILLERWRGEPKGEERTILWEQIKKLNAAAETAEEEMEKADNYWDRTGMGKQHPNIYFQPVELNIGHLQPGQKFRVLLPTGRERIPGDKPYVVRTAVGEGHPDFYINEAGQRTMRTMIPVQIISGSRTQAYRELNQHSLDVDNLMPGQKYLIVMNNQASMGFEGVTGNRRYEHESIKIANWEQKCNSMAVGTFEGMSTWDTFVERVNVDGVPQRDRGFVGSRAGEKHEEYKKNLKTKIIRKEKEIREEERKRKERHGPYSKDNEEISQLKKDLVKIKRQLAEEEKIKSWTHYKIKQEKLVEGLKEEGNGGRLKRVLENTDGLPPVHIREFPDRTIPSPHPDNIAPDTLVARFSCIQDIIEPGLPRRSRISEWVSSMKPDYVYFPADGVRQTNGHTQWLFKFYPLKDEIKNIKDRKTAALQFMLTGELEGTPSTTECGDIPLMIQKDTSGKGMGGRNTGGVCELPHRIASKVLGYLEGPASPPRGLPGGGGRKKTRRKSHKKAHKKTRRKSHKKANKKKRKKTRRRSHKKKRTTRKKKIKRK